MAGEKHESPQIELMHEIISAYGVKGPAITIFAAIASASPVYVTNQPVIMKIRTKNYVEKSREDLDHLVDVGLIAYYTSMEFNITSVKIEYYMTPTGMDLIKTIKQAREL